LRLAEQAQIAKAKADAASIKKTENESLRYKIKRGDTLSVIARKHNTSVKQLKEINNLSTDFIRTGDVLIIHLSKLDTIKKKIAKEAAAQKAAEADRVAKEKAEADRVAKEKAEAERVVAKEKAEAERIAKEKAEAERIAKEKAEAERIAKERAAKLAKEAEEKRIIEEVLEAAQKAEEERIALEASKPWYQFW
jgi:LysM repeat protein